MLWIQTEKIYIDENNEVIVKIHEKKWENSTKL